MYFISFEYEGQRCVGVRCSDEKHVLWLARAEQKLFSSSRIPSSMREIIEAGDEMLSYIASLVAAADKQPGCCGKISLDTVTLRAPYANPPRNIFCIGLNYYEHALEFEQTTDPAKAVSAFPIVFTKPCTAIADPDCAVPSHADLTSCYDYETELAVIIGKGGRSIAKENAFDHVFGYAIINDMSARDLQKRTSQWFSGKCLDQSAPFGPYLVHKNAVPDPHALDLRCWINAELRQNSNTRLMIFDIPTIIATISNCCNLLPGDIIATGTCFGVGMGFTPPKYLKQGDVIEMEIERLGRLRNSIA